MTFIRSYLAGVVESRIDGDNNGMKKILTSHMRSSDTGFHFQVSVRLSNLRETWTAALRNLTEACDFPARIARACIARRAAWRRIWNTNAASRLDSSVPTATSSRRRRPMCSSTYGGGTRTASFAFKTSNIRPTSDITYVSFERCNNKCDILFRIP